MSLMEVFNVWVLFFLGSLVSLDLAQGFAVLLDSYSSRDVRGSISRFL